MSYREDADIQHRYYGYLENITVLHENLTETIEAFGSENRHIAQKKSLVNFYLFLFDFYQQYFLIARRSCSGPVRFQLWIFQ